MEYRLLRYFVAVAEELHMARAADRLGIEQSPVSRAMRHAATRKALDRDRRAMRHLERRLGVQLFDRSYPPDTADLAGHVLLGECRRVMATMEQTIQATKAAAQDYKGYLRIAICDSLAQPRIASLLALSREDEPELEIWVFELPFSQNVLFQELTSKICTNRYINITKVGWPPSCDCPG